MTKRVNTHLLASALALASMTAHAQLLKYNSKAEVHGAAAVSPTAGGQVLERLVALCANFGDPARLAGEAALKDWKARHQAYMDENAIIKRSLLSALSESPAPDPHKQELRHMLEVAVPKMIDAQFAAASLPIDSLFSNEAKASLCMDYIQSINDGKWDLRRNDPVVASFLDASIAARKARQDARKWPTRAFR